MQFDEEKRGSLLRARCLAYFAMVKVKCIRHTLQQKLSVPVAKHHNSRDGVRERIRCKFGKGKDIGAERETGKPRKR